MVMSTPSLQLFAAIGKCQEPVRVQTFGTQLAVERLDEAVVRGFSWPREVKGHVVCTDQCSSAIAEALTSTPNFVVGSMHHVHASLAVAVRVPSAVFGQVQGRGLTNADLLRLTSQCPNISIPKAKGTAIGIADLVAQSAGKLEFLNGRSGLELTDVLPAGADGFILAPDIVDHVLRIQILWSSGDRDTAERVYRDILPTILFVMQSIEHLVTYGKPLFGL